jgi:hypothetical protein
METYLDFIHKVYFINKNKLIENFLFNEPLRNGDLGPRGITGYRGYTGIRGPVGLKGEKGEPGTVNIPFQIVHKRIIYPLPLSKGAIRLSENPVELYFGGGLSDALEKDDSYMKYEIIKKDPKIIRRTRIYAIYSDNSTQKTSRTLEVEVGPCGYQKFPTNCTTFKYNLPLKGGVIDYLSESYEGFSNWVDTLVINNKTTIRAKISKPKEIDLNKGTVFGNLYYMEFQVCDFYGKIDNPYINKIII